MNNIKLILPKINLHLESAEEEVPSVKSNAEQTFFIKKKYKLNICFKKLWLPVSMHALILNDKVNCEWKFLYLKVRKF